MVTDELVEFLEEKPGESYELFQQTPEWHRIQEREAVKASDRVRAARRTGFLAGHRAAEAVVDVYFSPSAIALAITTRLRDRESGDLANFMAAQENV